MQGDYSIPYIRLRRKLAGGLAIAVMAALAAITPGAQAATPEPAASIGQQDLAKLATTLETSLGDRSAGSYLDQATGKLIVTITDGSAAQSVRAAGAIPRLVAHSRTDLTRATEELDRSARIAGTAWGVDPATNQVLVSVDESVNGPALAKLKSVASKLGTVVRVEAVKGRFNTLATPVMKDGTAIYTGQGRCSLGFNVLDANLDHYFLTAGHCTAIGSTWYADQARTSFLGSSAGGFFGLQGDFGFVHYEGAGIVVLRTVAGTNLTVTGWGDAVVGQSVSRSGSTTGVHGGTVTSLNETVNYHDGTPGGTNVAGLIKTTVCAEPGDSGGPLYKLSTPGAAEGLGLTSGGNGNCSVGGTTFFQPIGPIMIGYALQMWH
jgi:streptogrisin D